MSKHSGPVPFFDYEIHPSGAIVSRMMWRGQSSRPLHQYADKNGYRRVHLVINKRRRWYRVHRLVCEAYHGAPPVATPMACHRDGNKDNNCAENLYWGSAQENVNDRTGHGTTSTGSTHAAAVGRGIEYKRRLIAAAPELLEALKHATNGWLGEHIGAGQPCPKCAEAKALIRRIEGDE